MSVLGARRPAKSPPIVMAGSEMKTDENRRVLFTTHAWGKDAAACAFGLKE